MYQELNELISCMSYKHDLYKKGVFKPKKIRINTDGPNSVDGGYGRKDERYERGGYGVKNSLHTPIDFQKVDPNYKFPFHVFLLFF